MADLGHQPQHLLKDTAFEDWVQRCEEENVRSLKELDGIQRMDEKELRGAIGRRERRRIFYA